MSRRRPYPVADHRDAVVDMAKTAGLEVIHDSGPGYDGKLIVLADQAQAHEYLHGASSRNVGILVEVGFNTRGEVDKMRATINGQHRAEIRRDARGSAGERLYWTLHLFSELAHELGYRGEFEL